MTCEYPENAASRAYRKGCRCDRCTTYRREASAKYRATPEGRERGLKHHANWRAKTEVKKRRAEYNSKWSKTAEGAAYKRATEAKRRATKLNQTPDYANLDLIKRIYLNCPEGFHVEHMLPLSRGGLHHENNLCYLPESVNISKGDRTIEEFGQEQFHASAVYWQTTLEGEGNHAGQEHRRKSLRGNAVVGFGDQKLGR